MAMMFSTKARYALRFMVDLAQHPGWISLKDISERQDISRKYLEQISGLMVKAHLVESQRGKMGGYRLMREPKDYSVLEILRAAEGSVAPVACVACKDSSSCPHTETCPTKPLWEGLSDLTSGYLDSKTLQDLL